MKNGSAKRVSFASSAPAGRFLWEYIGRAPPDGGAA